MQSVRFSSRGFALPKWLVGGARTPYKERVFFPQPPVDYTRPPRPAPPALPGERVLAWTCAVLAAAWVSCPLWFYVLGAWQDRRELAARPVREGVAVVTDRREVPAYVRPVTHGYPFLMRGYTVCTITMNGRQGHVEVYPPADSQLTPGASLRVRARDGFDPARMDVLDWQAAASGVDKP